jgi:hypothetical protein
VVDEKGEVDSSFAMSFPSSKFVVWATADPKEEIPTVRKSESGTQIGRAPHPNQFNGCHSHMHDVAFLLTFSVNKGQETYVVNSRSDSLEPLRGRSLR